MSESEKIYRKGSIIGCNHCNKNLLYFTRDMKHGTKPQEGDVISIGEQEKPVLGEYFRCHYCKRITSGLNPINRIQHFKFTELIECIKAFYKDQPVQININNSKENTTESYIIKPKNISIDLENILNIDI